MSHDKLYEAFDHLRDLENGDVLPVECAARLARLTDASVENITEIVLSVNQESMGHPSACAWLAQAHFYPNERITV